MKKIVSVGLIFLLLLSVMTGCSQEKPEATKAPTKEEVATEAEKGEETKAEEVTPEEKAPYKIGVFLRFSDEAGTKMKATIQHAIGVINDNGGANGHELSAVYYDTEGDSTKAVDAFTRLITQDKVLMAIGPTTSSDALAVIDLCKEYEIPLITPQATNTSITADHGNEWFFRNSVADIYHSYTLCDYVVNDLEATKIAFIHETATLGLGQYENFVERLKNEYGMEPTIVQEWNEGDVDFKTQLLAVKAAEPDVIVLAGHEAELSIAVSQRLDVGITKDVPVCGFSSMSSADFYGIAGQAAVGSIFSTTFSPTDSRPEVQAFVEEYTPVVNGSLDHNSAQAYDTVLLVAEILTDTALSNEPDKLAEDRVAIRDALAGVKNWVGITGVTTFGKGGGPEDRDGKKVSSIYKLEEDYTWSLLKSASE